MKHDFDKDIDSLLRGHGATASRASAPASAHMDADELSAFAENALPPATRARYVSHLADCEQCRRTVAGIALASNVVSGTQENVVATESTPFIAAWRARLAAFFSPRAIRYAAPLVAVLLVGAVAFIAVRRERPSLIPNTETAQDERPIVTTSVSSRNDTTGDAANMGTSGTPNAPATPPATTTGTVPAPEVRSAPSDGPVGQGGGMANGSAGVQIPSVTVNSEPPPPPPAQVATAAASPAGGQTTDDSSVSKARVNERAAGENRREAEGAVQSRQVRELPTRDRASAPLVLMSPGVKSEAAKEQEARNAPTAPPAAAPGGSTAQKSARTRSESIGERKADRESDRTTTAETRAVGGRKFQRQGSAWVDTAYSQPRATVNIRRGSEQYRALVADEPELRRIVEELGGEVVVVWKGRAYRIR